MEAPERRVAAFSLAEMEGRTEEGDKSRWPRKSESSSFLQHVLFQPQRILPLALRVCRRRLVTLLSSDAIWPVRGHAHAHVRCNI